MPESVAVILGSAFADTLPGDVDLDPRDVDTRHGTFRLHRVRGIERGDDRRAYVSFRHGLPHERLPNQINYRAQAAALKAVGCQALVVTSSVGVLDPDVPLDRPLLVDDLVMLDNRLPDGTACTMFDRPSNEHGHLVLNGGMFDGALNDQVRAAAEETEHPIADEVLFAYVQGPRSKTAAENRLWAQLGAQVNSMTLAPEVVLANELEIPCSGLAVGHKYSIPDRDPPEETALSDTLDRSRDAQLQIVRTLLKTMTPVPFQNTLYRFE